MQKFKPLGVGRLHDHHLTSEEALAVPADSEAGRAVQQGPGYNRLQDPVGGGGHTRLQGGPEERGTEDVYRPEVSDEAPAVQEEEDRFQAIYATHLSQRDIKRLLVQRRLYPHEL